VIDDESGDGERDGLSVNREKNGEADGMNLNRPYSYKFPRIGE